MKAEARDPNPATPPRRFKLRPPSSILALLLAGAVLIVYWPALHGGFLWDDDSHISGNAALTSAGGLYDIWFKPGATCQYYPLTFTVFWAGYQLWGLNTFGYHLLTLLLHVAAAVLLWRLLARLSAPGAFLAGAIFALHPVCVMSVAWMTELKNTLSGALALGAALAYVRYAGLGVDERNDYEKIERRTSNAEHRSGFGPLSLLLFLAAMFAKTAVSFLPVTLLLIVWWKRERLTWRRLWPTAAMLVIALALGLLTIHVEQRHGTGDDEFRLGLLERVLVSGRSFWFYLGKIFFPHPLTFIYERWTVDTGAGWQYLFPAAALGLLATLWRLRNRLGRGLFVAALHFYIATSMLVLRCST
jgi:hypothetical protein